MAAIHYDSLFEACRELFGPEIVPSRDFLHYLQHNGIKSAFRRMAKETHPDKFNCHPHQTQAVQAERFCQVKTAYEILCRFVSQREEANGRHNLPYAKDRPAYEARKDTAGYHNGTIPQHTLQLGRYLYYRKAITFRELLLALNWQQSTRRPVGAIAREWGWMTASDVGTVMSANIPGRFGEKAVCLGLMDERRLRLMITEQKLRRSRLGQYFVEHQLLTLNELNVFLRDLRLHNAQVVSMS